MHVVLPSLQRHRTLTAGHRSTNPASPLIKSEVARNLRCPPCVGLHIWARGGVDSYVQHMVKEVRTPQPAALTAPLKRGAGTSRTPSPTVGQKRSHQQPPARQRSEACGKSGRNPRQRRSHHPPAHECNDVRGKRGTHAGQRRSHRPPKPTAQTPGNVLC